MPAQDGIELPVTAPFHQPGEVVEGRYRLLSELGHGGMGIVYLAEDLRLQRQVAIKFLRSQATDTDAQRFLREAQLLASLSHPNVVKVFDLGQIDGRPYFVMEYLEGRTLADVLAMAMDGLPVDVALGFGRQLCEALDAVHRQGIIHRDIKPGNVIVAGNINAVLMDFGLARKEVSAKERGLVSGTPQYLAPEDIRGQPLAGDEARRSDIYALGITLYELIAGRPPFTDDNTAVLLHRQLAEAPVPLCDLRPDVPAAFEAVIMRALEKDPARRQGSCSELVVELSRARDAVVQQVMPPEKEPPVWARAGNATITSDPIQADEMPTSRPTSVRRRTKTPFYTPLGPSTGEVHAAIVALVLNGGPLRDSLADSLRVALPGCEIALLPSGSMPISDALLTLIPGCVVIDMDLLDDSPLELCAMLRSSEATATVPILLVGEDLDPEQHALLHRMGVTAVIPKPIDAARLAIDVQRALGG